jgi:cyclopropane-fatty-acyl-phospholipid synthase
VTTSTRHAPRCAVDPGRWPDVAVAEGSPLRAAVARALFTRAVAKLPVRVRLPDGQLLGAGAAGGPGAAESLGRATVPTAPVMVLHRPREFFRRLGASGLIGFGESYMAGDWDCADLTGLLTVFAEHAGDLVPPGLQRMRSLAVRRPPAGDRQTRDGARHNIGRHYDLSNELFALFLDETMTYSSALFETRAADGTPLAADHLLAARRIAEAGLASRIRVDLRDYREVEGTFDAICSCEMLEAVGERYWDAYFAALDRHLAPGGRIGLQTITMPHDRMLATRHTYTWIHIFPGGLIPSLTAIENSLTSQTRLRITARTDFGPHYAETLRIWRDRFGARAEEVERLSFDEVFNRMWRFYLCYSEAGFRSGYIGVSQLTLARI